MIPHSATPFASSVAQATLLVPAATAAKDGKSHFLRREAFRLLCMLLNPKFNSGSTEFDALTMKKTKESLNDVSASICNELDGAGTQRIKRIREVLKAAEKLLELVQSCSFSLSNIDELSKVIAKLESQHESESVQTLCQKLTGMIGELGKPVSKEDSDKVDEDDTWMDERDDQGESSKTGNKKSKKKKKKKGKRGKN